MDRVQRPGMSYNYVKLSRKYDRLSTWNGIEGWVEVAACTVFSLGQGTCQLLPQRRAAPKVCRPVEGRLG